MTQEQNLLVVAGSNADSDDDVQYLHRSVARLSFQRRFELANDIKAVSNIIIRLQTHTVGNRPAERSIQKQQGQLFMGLST
ncbi:hypothetical protein [Rhizobium leguminosarum]|uniref:hypothetical protein n=1 Tax=Rhizobium leguminosarum TaxID=384 RepID=UPI000399C1EC|nr:hypothetical protein [Rhizobium leguminosarum]